MTLAEVAAACGAQLRGNPALPITGVATLQNAHATQISFLTNTRYRRYLAATQAVAVVVTPELAQEYADCGYPGAWLLSSNPQLTFARIAALFAPPITQPVGIHPSAVVSPEAQIDPSASIGPQVCIEAGVHIDAGVVIGPGCVIGAGVHIGRDSRLVARVTLCYGISLGERVIVHPGAVIGSDGFGLANDRGVWVKIPQLGSVRIGNDVEIGANTTIDRGALDDTIIEDGVKLDNLIQIAHNVQIGAHSAMAGCVGIAGSVKVGRHCTLGGGVGLAGHLELADHVHVTGMSLVTKSLLEPGVYSSGLAVEPSRQWNKISARLRRLEDVQRRLSALERQCGRSDSLPTAEE